ncbi:hypothetical protein ABFS83_01G089800 [Erythranthe nasuta]
MSMQKLLDIDPQQLAFRFEVGRQASCRIKISNNSQEHIAFKVMTTNVHKYRVQPKAGVLSPEECLEITVTMLRPTEIPYNMECDDKFLIRSVVATPNHTPENAYELFNSEGTHAFEDCRLKVMFVSPNASASQLGRIGIDLLKNGIFIVFLCLIFPLLGIKILPRIWSLKFWMMVLIVQLAEKLLPYSAENWIGYIKKFGLYVCVHFVLVVCSRGMRSL